MYLIVIGWLYVSLMMAVAEATNSTGTVIGGMITFVLYGLIPMALVVYLMGAPLRRKKIKAQEAAERAAASVTHAPDADGEPAAPAPLNLITPVGKEL